MLGSVGIGVEIDTSAKPAPPRPLPLYQCEDVRALYHISKKNCIILDLVVSINENSSHPESTLYYLNREAERAPPSAAGRFQIVPEVDLQACGPYGPHRDVPLWSFSLSIMRPSAQ